MVEPDCENHGDYLPRHRGNRSAPDAEPWKTEETKNHNRIQNNIDDGAGSLGHHAVDSPSRGLHNTFKGHLHKDSEGENETDGKILRPELHNLPVFSLAGKEQVGTEDAHQGKYKITDEGQKYAVDGGEVGLFLAFFPKGAGEQCIDTDTGTG